VLLGLTLFPEHSQAQITSKIINQPCTACEPFTVQSADLDGDDDRDVVSVSRNDGKIAWHENLSSGEFSSQNVLTADHTTVPSSIDLADLDGDGDVDVFSGEAGASFDDDTLIWYENDGTGTFDRDTIRVVDASVGAVRSVDLDNDDDGDLLAELSSTLVRYESTDSGFADRDTVQADFRGEFRSSDLNGDAYPDLLATGGGSTIARYENLDGEGFAAPDTLTTSLDNVQVLEPTDLDSDGDQDILFVNLINNFVDDDEYEIAWLENQDDGGFSDKTLITDELSVFGGSLSAADVEGDDDMDIVVGRVDQLKLSLLTNDGSESFSSPTTITTGPPIEASTTLSLHLANLDGDTDADVLASSSRDDQIAWYESRVDRGEGVVAQGAINALPDVESPLSVSPSDLDGDEDPDVLVADGGVASTFSRPEGGKIVWYENLEDGFASYDTISTTVTSPRTVRAADIDGDDDKDVLTASVSDQKVFWYENVDDGGFSENTLAADQSAQLARAADLDDDGDLDILSAGDRIAWLENLDGGGFSSLNEIATTSRGVLSLETADLDGDGDPEILAGLDRVSDVIAWYENLDDGGFSDANEFSARTPVSLDVADLDGDGDPDLLAAERSGDDEITWYENLDDGGFSEDNLITGEVSGAQSVHAADLTGDGDPDVLSASSAFEDNKLAWYKNLDDSTFSEQKLISEQALGPTSVHAADLDADADLDVLSTSTQDDKVAWYESTNDNLPVDLVGLTARANGPGAVLSWTTASETNNAGFAIQHKAPSEESWTKRGFVDSNAPGGTATEAQSYRFTAENLSVGTHQFRLKQVDLDGTAHVSKTVTAEIGLDEPVRLTAPAPNPVQNRATLSFAVKEAQETTIRLYNVLGQEVATLYRGTPAPEESQTVNLSASDLSSGVYFLRLQAGGQTRTQKVTVMR
jgi:hypothetical protein